MIEYKEDTGTETHIPSSKSTDLFAREENKMLLQKFIQVADTTLSRILLAHHAFISHAEQFGFSSEQTIITPHILAYIKQHKHHLDDEFKDILEQVEAGAISVHKKHIVSMMEILFQSHSDEYESLKKLIKSAKTKGVSPAANVLVRKVSHGSTMDMMRYDIIVNIILAYNIALEEKKQLENTEKDKKALIAGGDKIISKFINSIPCGEKSNKIRFKCREIFDALYSYYKGNPIFESEYENDINDLKILKVEKPPKPSIFKRLNPFNLCARRQKQTPDMIFSTNINALIDYAMSNEAKDCITVSQASFGQSFQSHGYDDDKDSHSSNDSKKNGTIPELEADDSPQNINLSEDGFRKLLEEKAAIQEEEKEPTI